MPPSAPRSGSSRTPAQTAEFSDFLQREAELTAGHGILRASVSASDPEELEHAVAAVEQAAIQASCETRRL